jgi:methyl coenzyme M reductase subunit C-like uncharacterized protein (methanogenesis marker protein 7)
MLLAAEDENGVVSLLDPGEAVPGAIVYVEGISRDPVKVLDFDDFKQINMTVDENQEVTYKDKKVRAQDNTVVADKPVKPGAKVL